MKKNNKIIGVILIMACLTAGCGGNSKNDEKSDSTAVNQNENATVQEALQRPAYNYNQVIKAQDSLLKLFSWPAKHELDLNDDGQKEEFLAIEGYSRGMGYALFSKDGNNWKLLSGEESIASGHLGINKLDKKNGVWHDFVALQPSGRDGIIESYYSWDGKLYILKDQKEVGY